MSPPERLVQEILNVEFRDVLNMKRRWYILTTSRGNPVSENKARDWGEPSATWNIRWFWYQTLARGGAGQVVTASRSDSNMAAGAMFYKLSRLAIGESVNKSPRYLQKNILDQMEQIQNHCNFSIFFLPSTYHICSSSNSLPRALTYHQSTHPSFAHRGYHSSLVKRSTTTTLASHYARTSFHIHIYSWTPNLLLSCYKNVFGVILSKFHSMLHML